MPPEREKKGNQPTIKAKSKAALEKTRILIIDSRLAAQGNPLSTMNDTQLGVLVRKATKSILNKRAGDSVWDINEHCSH